MEKIISNFTGKRVDLFCTHSVVFRGTIESVEGGIVRLVDDDERIFYVAVEGVVGVSETVDSASRPGFRA